MTDGYFAKVGWSQTGLNFLNPQPASTGILYGSWDNDSYSRSYPQGRKYTIWTWSIVVPDAVQWPTILAYLGLSETVFNNLVTVQTRNNDDTWGTYNGYASYPQGAKRNMPFWEGVQIMVSGLR